MSTPDSGGSNLGAIPPDEQIAKNTFDEKRRRLGLFLGPFICLLLYFIPIPDLNPAAHRLLAIMGLVITFWVTEAIPLPVTALLGPGLCVLAALGPPRNIFKSFGDPIIFLFIGSFLLAEGMFRHGLNRRMAVGILGSRWIGGKPSRLLPAFIFLTGGISMWISNTATTAMMFPIGLALLRELGGGSDRQSASFSSALMLMAAFASSAGGVATPVGAAPNLIGIGMIERTLQVKVNFFQWMAIGLPLALLLMVFLALYFQLTAGKTVGHLPSNWMREQASTLGPWSRGERNVLAAFVAAIFFWILPGMFSVMGWDNKWTGFFDLRLTEPMVALLAGCSLFLLPCGPRHEPTLEWSDAKRIDWGTILLFGGGLALGELMFSTGLADWMGRSLVSLLQVRSSFGLILLFTVVSVIVSELTSNTASASMVTPVAIAVAQAAQVDPIGPALAACLGAGMGSMFPVSTPPNAIVYGSGLVPLPFMMKHGLIFDLVSILVITLLVSFLVPLLF